MTRRVLVVDDCKDAADALAMVIQAEGYDVQVTYTGEEAISIAQSDPPEVVLLDLGMPQLNGFSVGRELRNQPKTKDALIVAVTGYGLPGDRARCEAAGFDLHLLKPVQLEQLNAVLQTYRSCP